jgi:hypothetical protein
MSLLGGISFAEGVRASNTPLDIKIEQPLASVRIQYVTDQIERERIMRSFQSELSKYGSAKIVSCDPIVEVSQIETNGDVLAGKDSSYGASCEVRSKGRDLSLSMCDFPMVGKFTVTGSGGIDLEWFSQFIRTNCPAGG